MLKDQAESGINKKALLAAINTGEFKYREADFGNYPKGLIWCLNGFTSWLYDEDDPFTFFEQGKIYDELRREVDTGYFEGLIEKYILKNPHKVIAVMNPSKGLVSKQEERLKDKLNRIKQELSEDEIDEIIKNTAFLKEFQNTPSSPEELAMIPQLSREDLKKEAMPYNNIEKSIGDIKLLAHPMFTSGITYMKLMFDVEGIDKKLIPYLGLYKAVFASLNTENFSYNELANEINLKMGGLMGAFNIYTNVRDEKKYRFFFEVGFKAFDGRVEDSIKIIKDLLSIE